MLPAWLDRAAREEVGYAEFLQGLLDEEAMARANAATERRLRQAGFPFAATIEQFDFRFRPDLKRQVVLRYLDPTFVEQARSLALVGAPGLGKTMLAVCIATKHVQLGATARFVTAQTLAHHLGRPADGDGPPAPAQAPAHLRRAHLDELGYLPTSPAFGPALYELIAGRYERRPTLLTSNKSLTEWGAIVQDASLAAALVDRILHHGDVFYLKGPSWRLEGPHARRRGAHDHHRGAGVSGPTFIPAGGPLDSQPSQRRPVASATAGGGRHRGPRPRSAASGSALPSCRRPEQPQLAGALDRFGAFVRVELGIDLAHVRLDRAGRDAELGGDVGRGQIARQVPEHAQLARTQRLAQRHDVGGAWPQRARPRGRPGCPPAGRRGPCAAGDGVGAGRPAV